MDAHNENAKPTDGQCVILGRFPDVGIQIGSSTRSMTQLRQHSTFKKEEETCAIVRDRTFKPLRYCLAVSIMELNGVKTKVLRI